MVRKKKPTYLINLDLEKIDQELPLNLHELSDVVAAVALKYPLLKKSQIGLICRTFLEEMRSQVLMGNSVNLKGVLYNMRMYTYCKLKRGKLVYNTRVQVSTPARWSSND